MARLGKIKGQQLPWARRSYPEGLSHSIYQRETEVEAGCYRNREKRDNNGTEMEFSGVGQDILISLKLFRDCN